MNPCLVHFPDRDPRIVMCPSDEAPRAGEMLITGWIVERQAPAAQSEHDYDLEIWVRPIAA